MSRPDRRRGNCLSRPIKWLGRKLFGVQIYFVKPFYLWEEETIEPGVWCFKWNWHFYFRAIEPLYDEEFGDYYGLGLIYKWFLSLGPVRIQKWVTTPPEN
jgi:hypothetical protein